MSETATPPAPTAAPGSDPGASAAPAVVVPEGYVPAAEVETAREEARRRYQSELDTAKAELTKLKATPAPTPAAGGTPDGTAPGFDPAEFRTSLLRDVSGVIGMTQAAADVKAKFPHADPGLFTPEKLATFASPDALHFTAKDSHDRVTAILGTEKESIEATLRAEFEAKYGNTGGEGAAQVVVAGGDPTPAQVAAMSFSDMNAYEKAHPGVIERVLLSAERKEAGS